MSVHIWETKELDLFKSLWKIVWRGLFFTELEFDGRGADHYFFYNSPASDLDSAVAALILVAVLEYQPYNASITFGVSVLK